MPPCGVKQHLGAFDVGRDELARAVLDRLLHVRLCGGVDDHIDRRDELIDVARVADVALDEAQPLMIEDVREVADAARVGQRVHDHDLVIGLGEQVAAEVRADEAGATGHEHTAHSSTSWIT